MSRALVIDDDASRHGELGAWCEQAGIEARIEGSVPDPDSVGELDCVVLHAGYGRARPGFPRSKRRAEAVYWFLDEPSYLFHEELDALRALGTSTGSGVGLIVMTGGSEGELPAAELATLGRERRVVVWNVFGLMATRSLDQALAGPDPGGAPEEPDRVQSEIRHDLLNRLWNLALAAAEAPPDAEEIASIVEGEDDQTSLDVLVARAGLGSETSAALADACRAARSGSLHEALARVARKAIEEIESR
jgi:hypothetical protein